MRRCPSCMAGNAPSRRFCAECGSRLPSPCPACGFENEPTAKFCGGCGKPVGETAAPPAPAPSPPPRSDTAERRQLTVMFSDLVGSTALSARLDAEDLREVIGAYHRCVADTVARFDGFVAKYMGDGVLIYFGYPEAHEDDAERAVRVGLALIEAIDKLRTQERLQVRIGIATGLVIVGDLIGSGEAQERGVVGETPNLAARLQAVAKPGAVVIASSTRQLVGNLIECVDLGAVKLKGIAKPVHAWQALRTSAFDSRFEAFHSTALKPLVGRAEEIGLLLRCWQRAKRGDGQVVLLWGEPGIGKSRIVAALEEQLQAEMHTRLRYFCSPYHGDSALFPIITQLERAAEFKRTDRPETKFEKLEALLTPASPPEGNVALLAELLSLPASEGYPTLNLSPQQKKQMTFEALLWWLGSPARKPPVLVVYEDAHWIDPTSHELLDLAVGGVRSLPMLFVVTARPEFQPPWIDKAHVITLTLNRFDRHEGVALVGQIAGNNALSTEIVDEIVDRTDGIPLFVEELTKAVLEAGAGERNGRRVVTATPQSALAVPPTLHASLLARLDRVGPSAKEIAQIGAAVGREFSYELIQAVTALDEQPLANALGRLVASELLFQRGITPEATYIFKHALVQDAAYSTLLRSMRQELHGRIAEVLQERFPETAELRPEVLARHFTEAKRVNSAVGYWLKAGQLANARSTSREAVSHLTKGLELSRELTNDPEHDRIELALQSTIGPALVATKGYAAPETLAAYERARELMRATNEFSAQGGVLAGLFTGYYGLAKYDQCFEIGREFLETAERRCDPVDLCLANRMIAVCNNLKGHFPTARDYAERAWSYYNPERDGPLAWRYAHDIGVSAKTHLALAVWHLGQLERSASLSSEVFAMARRSQHLNTMGYSLWYAGSVLSFFARDFSALRAFSDRLQAFGHEHQLPNWTVRGVLLEPPALAATGELKKAIAQVDTQSALQDKTENTSLKPLVLAGIAEVFLRAGRGDRALPVVDHALASAEASGELWINAELWRLRADAHLVADGRKNLKRAQACYHCAMTIAEGQGSRMLRLRAAVSLARLRRDQGRRVEARDLLAPVYGWFTEGFDTADLRDAKALLDELG